MQKMVWAALIGLLAGFPIPVLSAPAADSMALPAPEMGGRPLMEVLRDRHSNREFGEQPLPRQELSNLLWAAFGINRPESGKRTAPSARNWQEIDLYITTAEGLFLYAAEDHALVLIHGRDIRAHTGRQAFPATAALNLVYVADLEKIDAGLDPQQRREYGALDTGFIAQNVYLYCASAGLATVARAHVDRETLAREMGLRDTQWIVLAQTVGYPAR